MELDGYNKDLYLAFEAQGEQHYRAVTYLNQSLKDLEQTIEDDLAKFKLCEQNGVILIQMPYYIKLDSIKKQITTEHERLANKELPLIPKIDYNKFFEK